METVVEHPAIRVVTPKAMCANWERDGKTPETCLCVFAIGAEARTRWELVLTLAEARSLREMFVKGGVLEAWERDFEAARASA